MASDPSLRPVRTTDRWREEPITDDDSGERSAGDPDSRVVITRRREPRNRLDAFLFRLFDTPRERDLRLDPVGSEVWRRCDGDHTVAGIEAALDERFSDERVAPVEETLSYFLTQLSELGLVRGDSAR